MAAREMPLHFRHEFVNGEYDISMVKFVEEMHINLCEIATKKGQNYLDRQLNEITTLETIIKLDLSLFRDFRGSNVDNKNGKRDFGKVVKLKMKVK